MDVELLEMNVRNEKETQELVYNSRKIRLRLYKLFPEKEEYEWKKPNEGKIKHSRDYSYRQEQEWKGNRMRRKGAQGLTVRPLGSS